MSINLQVPEVLDAVYLHSSIADMIKYVEVWERKNHIAEVIFFLTNLVYIQSHKRVQVLMTMTTMIFKVVL